MRFGTRTAFCLLGHSDDGHDHGLTALEHTAQTGSPGGPSTRVRATRWLSAHRGPSRGVTVGGNSELSQLSLCYSEALTCENMSSGRVTGK